MEFKVLGPVVVTDATRTIDVGGPRQRRLLAALLANANAVVPSDTLIEIVFEGAPPQGASTTIRSYVARLRKALGAGSGAEVVTEPPGYSLRLDLEDIDATRFASAAARARRQIDEHVAADAAETLRTALTLWRGPAYGEFGFEDWARGESARLDELRIDAEEQLIEAQLACGLAEDVIPDLRRLIEIHPLRERLRGQLMLALHRSGRHAEALRTFEAYRAELIEVGLDPTGELTALERSIAIHDPALQLVAPAGRALRGYRLGASLGVGRQGEVFRAVQPVIGRQVAIKVIRSDLADDPAFIRRFDHEAQTVSKLEHAHIVPLHDYWREPRAAYVVMRLLPKNLAEHLEDGPLDTAEATSMVQQLGSALAAAHRVGLLHGDLRPSNVLLDEDANFYLSDFGLAGLDPNPPDGGPEGRSGYVSPEVRSWQPPGRATDQFDLAVLTAHALTGVLPFGQRGVQSASDRFPSLHTQRAAIPAAVDQVVWRAAAWDPDDRYPDITDFVDAFVAALGGQRTDLADLEPPNPFKGLEPFIESDAEWFFGRDDVVDDVLHHLRIGGSPFVTVIGASGSGKSSLVRAGVVPRLRSGAVAGSADWFIATMVPGVRPFDDLEVAIRSIATQEEESERTGPRSISAILATAVPGVQSVLLVVDQLEELFTLTPEAERVAFIEELTAAVTEPGSRLRVVATLRADFHDRPLRYSRFGRLVADGAVAVVGMNISQLDQAIREPAARSGIEIEPSVVSEIIAGLVDQPAALPLLQFTLTELFECRSGSLMTLDAYRALGGVEAAIARRADEVYLGLPAAEQQSARRVFLRLFTVDETGSATRRRVRRSELAALTDAAHEGDRLVDAFGAARLLTFDRDTITREPTVEIAHESLTTQWPRLRAWVLEAGEGLRIRSQITAATSQWLANHRDDGDLHRGGRLDAALTWAGDPANSVTDTESEFLQASEERRDADAATARSYTEQQVRSNRRLRVSIGVVGIALVIAMITGFLAIGQRNQARTEAARADLLARRAETREVVASSTATLDIDPELSALLAIEAVRASDSTVLPEAEQALHRALLEHRLLATVPSQFGAPSFSPDGRAFAGSDADGRNGQVWTIDPLEEGVTLTGHTDGVTSASYSPDGRLIATSSLDGVRLWDADSGDQVDYLPGIPAARVVFSHDGSKLAVSGFGGEVVWDLVVDSATPFNAVGGDGGISLGMAFSPDDELLAVAINDARGAHASLFEPASGRLVTSFEGHTNTILDVEFSLDGSRLYSSSEDGTVKVWNVADGSELGTFTGQGAQVRGIDLSSDGTKMASVGGNGTVVIWDPITFRVEDRLLGHAGTVDAVEFSPDGSELITQSAEDQTTRIWSVASGWRSELVALPGGSTSGAPSVTAGAVAFDPTGESLIAAQGDRLRRWAIPAGRETASWDAPGASVRSIALNSDGSLLAAAGEDGATVYDTATGSVVATPFTGGEATNVDFDATDRLLASGPGAKLVEIATSQRTVLTPAQFWTYAAEFSPDGSRIALSHTISPTFSEVTAPFDGVVELVDAETFDVLATVDFGIVSESAIQRDAVTSVAFHPDGSLLALASKDGSTVIADGATLEVRGSLMGQGGEITAVAFDPSGSEIATASTNGTVRIWSVDSGLTRLTLPSENSVADISYSPDGRYLAATDPDGSVTVFVLDLDELVAVAQRRLTRPLTDGECERYLHTDSCQVE